jgi:hypothetical protein
MYGFVWSRSVLEGLAEIYVAAAGPERDRMATGIEAFNSRIARAPLDVGESRGDGGRLAFIPLLAVWFEVNNSTQRVEVTGVARYGV